MFVEQPRHRAGVDDVAAARRRARARRRGSARRTGRRATAQTGAVKPFFGCSTTCRGKRRSARSRSSDFGWPFGILRSRRNAERQLDEPVIEQRAADLEAVRHAHAIHLHERIVRHVDLEVGVLRALHGAGRRAVAIRRGDLLVDRAVGRIARRRLAEQRARVLRFQEAQVGVVGAGRIAAEIFEHVAEPQRARQRRATRGQRAPSHDAARVPAAPGMNCRAFASMRVRRVAPLVAAERFVAAVARQRHRDVLARHLADVVGRNRRRIGERFVERARRSGRARRRAVGSTVVGVVAGREVRRRQAGGFELVVRGVIESDRRGDRRGAAALRPCTRRSGPNRCRRRGTRRSALRFRGGCDTADDSRASTSSSKARPVARVGVEALDVPIAANRRRAPFSTDSVCAGSSLRTWRYAVAGATK